jgi:hypothetical protein
MTFFYVHKKNVIEISDMPHLIEHTLKRALLRYPLFTNSYPKMADLNERSLYGVAMVRKTL